MSIENDIKQSAKIGDYDNPEKGCPNCGRSRIMIGEDKKHRCEKCQFCIEDNEVDLELSDYMS